MRPSLRACLLACFLAVFVAPAAAQESAVFQYAIAPAGPKAKGTAYLWLPPAAKQIRGVLMAGMTLAEREMAMDAVIRKACEDERLAIVFLKTGLGSVDIEKTLSELARVSGYRELSVAPLFFAGHSAGGPQAKAAATQFKDRCFGLMQYRGGHPGGDDPVPPGIPALMMLGHYDEFGARLRDDKGRENWENGRDSMAAYRAANPANLGNIVIDPGAGHFPWSDRNAKYFALYLRKAAQARIPEFPVDAAQVTCKEIKPESGWLTDLRIKDESGAKPAPYGEYTGDKAQAGWHFDKEMADATLAYHRGGFNKKDQFVRWSNPFTLDAGARYFLNEVKWVGDGQTFEVNPIYGPTYPTTRKTKDYPHWAQAGMPVGHSSAPIRVRRVGGPIVPAGGHTFRVRCDALSPAADGGRVTFLAFSEGDAEYRAAEIVGMYKSIAITKGKDQTIDFPPVTAGKGPMELKATSDSGLPVEYYVASGPAVIEKNRLRITQVPARAAYPLEIKVVAYQHGRGIEPMVKTAAPVEQTIRITAP